MTVANMVNAMVSAHRHFYFATSCVLLDIFHYVGPLFYRLKAIDIKIKIMSENGLQKTINPASGNAVDTEDQAVLSLQCPACGRTEQIIWVHGHGQFAHCHTNVMPCCYGAVCKDLS